ncbi:TPA: hypothetical protein ACH3X1_012337 [Trebouxia sp. C0004]
MGAEAYQQFVKLTKEACELLGSSRVSLLSQHGSECGPLFCEPVMEAQVVPNTPEEAYSMPVPAQVADSMQGPTVPTSAPPLQLLAAAALPLPDEDTHMEDVEGAHVEPGPSQTAPWAAPTALRAGAPEPVYLPLELRSRVQFLLSDNYGLTKGAFTVLPTALLCGNEPPAKKGPGRPSKGKQGQPRARKQPAKDSAAKSDTPKPSSRSWEDTETINLLECWYYRQHDFKTAGKNGAKLAQIWIYEKLCDLMPGIKDVFSVKSCKDRVSNIRTKYKHAYDSMLLSGEARSR